MTRKNPNPRRSLVLLAGQLAMAAMLFLSGNAECAQTGRTSGQVSLAELRAVVQSLEQEAALIEEENQGIRNTLKAMDDDEIYLVVDTENNRLTMRRGDAILLVTKVGTGSHQFVKEETGRNWMFESPTGSLTVLGKERNPVWIRPDWSYVEENMPVPAPDDPDRIVRGVLGKYALLLGNGYKIHGTKYK